MELNLFRSTSIENLKQQFVHYFSHLKLEVFSRPHACRNVSVMQQRLDDKLLLSQIKTFYHEGVFAFQPSMTVTSFKQGLRDKFGLSVLVLRKSGDQWQETTQTENLTLEKQNLMGQASSKPMRVNLVTLFL